MILLDDARARDDLVTFAQRARRHDEAGALRLHATGGVLACWVGIIEGAGITGSGTVMGLRTFALSAESEEIDACVPLAAFVDRIPRAQDVKVPVPPQRLGPRWMALTPPRTGWEQLDEMSSEQVRTTATEGINELGRVLTAKAPASAVLEQRERVWGRMLPSGTSAGAAFAAHILGFVAPEGQITTWRNGPWRRLSTPYGHVLTR